MILPFGGVAQPTKNKIQDTIHKIFIFGLPLLFYRAGWAAITRKVGVPKTRYCCPNRLLVYRQRPDVSIIGWQTVNLAGKSQKSLKNT
jgi:hypothetical protein